MNKHQWLIKILSGAILFCSLTNSEVQYSSLILPNRGYMPDSPYKPPVPPSFYFVPGYNSGYSSAASRSEDEEEALRTAQDIAMSPLSNVMASVPMWDQPSSSVRQNQVENRKASLYAANNNVFNTPCGSPSSQCSILKTARTSKSDGTTLSTEKPSVQTSHRKDSAEPQSPCSRSWTNGFYYPNFVHQQPYYNYRMLYQTPYMYDTPKTEIGRPYYSWHRAAPVSPYRPHEYFSPSYNRFYNGYYY